MSAERQQKYYDSIRRMDAAEALRRSSNLQRIISGQQLWIEMLEEALENPQRTQQRLNEAKERLTVTKEEYAILRIHLSDIKGMEKQHDRQQPTTTHDISGS